MFRRLEIDWRTGSVLTSPSLRYLVYGVNGSQEGFEFAEMPVYDELLASEVLEWALTEVKPHGEVEVMQAWA